MNEIKYEIRQTNSWSYSIDKYKNWKFIETISRNNQFDMSNEVELNWFSTIIMNENNSISDIWFINSLRHLYDKKYWIFELDWLWEIWDSWLTLDDVKNDETRKVILPLLNWIEKIYEDWSWFEITSFYFTKFDWNEIWIKELKKKIEKYEFIETWVKIKVKYDNKWNITSIWWKENYKDFYDVIKIIH